MKIALVHNFKSMCVKYIWPWAWIYNPHQIFFSKLQGFSTWRKMPSKFSQKLFRFCLNSRNFVAYLTGHTRPCKKCAARRASVVSPTSLTIVWIGIISDPTSASIILIVHFHVGYCKNEWVSVSFESTTTRCIPCLTTWKIWGIMRMSASSTVTLRVSDIFREVIIFDWYCWSRTTIKQDATKSSFPLSVSQYIPSFLFGQ